MACTPHPLGTAGLSLRSAWTVFSVVRADGRVVGHRPVSPAGWEEPAWAERVGSPRLRSYMMFRLRSRLLLPRVERGPGASLLSILSLCATPASWAVGHRLHHAHVGNLGQDAYDWETVFPAQFALAFRGGSAARRATAPRHSSRRS